MLRRIISRLEDDDIDRAELADPSYKPKIDELAIKTKENRPYPFVPRMDSGQRDRLKRAVSVVTVLHRYVLLINSQ